MTGWLSRIRGTAVPFAAFAVVFRVICIFRYRVSNDEPQHLHVAWLWSQGLIGYRDFYDNHVPLFHLLFAPIVGAIRETPDVFVIARLFMVPLAIAGLALVWRIANAAYDRHIAAWTTIAAAVVPTFALRSTEFRNDNLWMVWSLLAIALALAPITRRRAALIAFVIGLSLLSSIKTVFFAAALGVALLLIDRPRRSIIFAAIGGFVVPIAAMLLWFHRHDALQEFYWCAFWVNSQLPFSLSRRILGVLLLIVAIAVVVWRLRDSTAPRARRIVAVTTALFIACVLALSPIVAPRDLLPAIPLLVLFTVAMLSARRAIVIAFAAWTIFVGRLWLPPSTYYPSLVQQVLQLTRPDEPVFDQKGETVFRRRPTYLALEAASRNLLSRGLARETFIEDLVRARCYVVTRDNRRFPPRTRRFLAENFIQFGVLRVAGSRVANGTFRIGVPGPYVIAGQREAQWYEPGVYPAPRGATHVIWQRAARVRR